MLSLLKVQREPNRAFNVHCNCDLAGSTGKILFHWWNYIQLSLFECSAYFADMASPFSGLLFTHKELNCRLSV